MAGEQVHVMLAVRDRRGEPSGRCAMLEVCRPQELDPLIKVEFGDLLDETTQPECTLDLRGLRFAGVARPFECSDWRRRVGNVHWDRCTMALDDALELVRVAIANGGSVTQWCDGPFEDLAEAAHAEA